MQCLPVSLPKLNVLINSSVQLRLMAIPLLLEVFGHKPKSKFIIDSEAHERRKQSIPPKAIISNLNMLNLHHKYQQPTAYGRLVPKCERCTVWCHFLSLVGICKKEMYMHLEVGGFGDAHPTIMLLTILSCYHTLTLLNNIKHNDTI